MPYMTSSEKIQAVDIDTLDVIKYPDPRLQEVCTPIDEIDVNEKKLRALVEKMAELMFDSNGVGLAAPQVGATLRLFLASPTFEQNELHVYINPRIVSVEGSEINEEGCLSFPNIFAKIKRSARIVIEATGLDGQLFTTTCQGLHARICQHENDHLEGWLLVDRMGSVAKLGNRKALQELVDQYDTKK